MPLSSDGPNFKARPLATRSSDSITGLKKRRQDGNPYQKRFDEKELCKAFLGKEIVREKVFRQEILSEEVFRKEVFREEVLGEEVFREEIFGEGDGGEAGNEARREIARRMASTPSSSATSSEPVEEPMNTLMPAQPGSFSSSAN